MSDARHFLICFWSGASCGSIVVPSIPRLQLLTELRVPTGGTKPPPGNRLVRGLLALLAFCHSFWAAAVSGVAVAANPRRRATARREGARAHSYASRGAAAVPWAGRSGHTMAIWGAHEGASAPWGLGSTKRARRKNSPIPGARHPAPRGPVGAKGGLRWPSRGSGRLITSRWWA
jgi:hypothetical protein